MSFATGLEWQRAQALYHLIKACTDESGNPKAPSAEDIQRAKETIYFWFIHEKKHEEA
jgi:hypothetical protein